MLVRTFSTRLGFGWVVVFALLGSTSQAYAAVTAAQKCQAGKNKVAGKYAACRQDAEARLATDGDATAYATAIGKCAAKYSAGWQRVEDAADGGCPSAGDEAAVASVLNECTGNVAMGVGGGTLADCPGDLATCTTELAACQSEPHGLLSRSGLTLCYDASGAEIACAGTGQDGELQAGLTRSYADNGDGTVTDARTGLVWEKLSDDGSIHDKDDYYSWTSAITVKVAALNATAFAGYTDWRFPNIVELRSLIDYSTVNPSIDAAFNIACIPGCTVLTCSCTTASNYWSSTTNGYYSAEAWAVIFGSGDTVSGGSKSYFSYVRAVRGGS